MSSPATALTRARVAISVPALGVPIALFGLAVLVRLAATFVVAFPLSEGSAYYVAVARNIATGRGLVVDAIWSYATPPLELPRAAFELWQPLASSLAAVPMWLLGPSFAAAQLGYALVGAVLAPLTWWIARDAAARLDIPDNRRAYVAAGAGLIAALAGPLVLAAAVPDSTLPFTVVAVGAAIAMPAAIHGHRGAIVAAGLVLGLAYLTRMEAIYLGVVFVALAWASGVRGMSLIGRIGAVAGIGALVALPWWLRNISVFGSPTPGGQLADNVLLTSNEQIFNWSARPTLDAFLAQGPATIAANIAGAAWHNAIDVLAVPGNVVVVVALLTIALGWRRWRTVADSPLMPLLAYGALVFAVTTVVFPVATLWGTFEHAAGPLLVAFVVLAALGGDAFVARVRAWRNWPRPNAGMAPAALAAIVLAMTVLQLTFAATQAFARDRQMSTVAQALRLSGIADGRPIISDRPVWLSDALGTPAVVLPHDGVASVTAVANRFGAEFIVLVDGAPTASDFATPEAARCFVPVGISTSTAASQLAVYRIDGVCR